MFRALDAKSGRVVWATATGSGAEQYFFHGDPLITSDLVVAGGDAAAGGHVHAFDRRSGTVRWKFPAGRGVTGPIAGLGRRAFAAMPDSLVSLDIDTGTPGWTRALKIPGFEGPAAAANRVFAGTVDGFLYALNADTGQDAWRTSLGAPVTTSVTVNDAVVYVGAQNGILYRVDSRNGAVLSSLKLDERLRPQSVPIIADDAVLVLLTDDAANYRGLVSADATLERVRWRVAAPKSWNTSRAFVWHDTVVLGTTSGDVLAYRATDGSIASSRSVTGAVRAIGGSRETLYVSTSQGSLYAFRQ
jgi:outer membrane protein assembly factor BamB